MNPSECLRGAGTRDEPLRMSALEASQGSAESGDENRGNALICTFQKQCTIFRMLCFEKRNLVMSLTNPYTICGRLTLKDVRWF